MSILQLAEPECLRHLLESPETAKWYAVYTAPRHEKRDMSKANKSTAFCRYIVRCGAGRTVARNSTFLYFPDTFLFISHCRTACACAGPGVLQLGNFQGQPAALPDADIELLRKGLAGNACAEPHPCLAAGRRVRVRSGGCQHGGRSGTQETEIPRRALD